MLASPACPGDPTPPPLDRTHPNFRAAVIVTIVAVLTSWLLERKSRATYQQLLCCDRSSLKANSKTS